MSQPISRTAKLLGQHQDRDGEGVTDLYNRGFRSGDRYLFIPTNEGFYFLTFIEVSHTVWVGMLIATTGLLPCTPKSASRGLTNHYVLQLLCRNVSKRCVVGEQ